jgi:hypothetical protein
VTLSSTVTPANSTGSVHFFDGSTDLGAATYNSTTGVATLTSTFTNATSADGVHLITAVFTPAGLFGSSTSSASSLIVPRPPAIATSTTLAVSQSTVAPGSTDVLTATATVTPASGGAVTGTVNFYVDGSSSANATKALVTGDNGSTGAVTINYSGLTGSSSPGTAHTIVATFTDGTNWSGSSSPAAIIYAAVCDGCGGDPQNIQTSIAAGTLDLSTALTISTPLLLPAMTLSSTADEYFSSLSITGLSMTDTRPGNLPYTLSLISTNLNKVGVTNPSANQSISGQNVGFNVTSLVSTNATPNTFLGSQTPGASTSGQNFTGFNNAAANHVQITDTGSLGLGGSTPHPILHANHGTGTTVVAATMTIRAPTNLLDGTYAGTVTFSVIGS